MVPSGWPSVCTGKDGGPVTPPPCSCRIGWSSCRCSPRCRVLGVIVVPIMPIYRREEVGYVVSNAEIRGVFTPATFKKFNYLDMYLGLRQEHPDLTIVVTRPDSAAETVIDADDGVFSLQGLEADTDDDGAREELPDPPGPDEPFVIVYTSGTTSRSKGCVHTFNTYCAGARALIAPFGYTEADVQFGPSPVAHTTGLVTSVLVPMLAGASTHMMAEWDPARGIDEIAALRLHGSGDGPDIPTRAVVRIRRRPPRSLVVAVVDMRGRSDSGRGRRAGQRNASQHEGA